MADVTSTFSSLSSTESNNAPSGATAVGTNLDDNQRLIQAHIAALRDQTGWGTINLTSVSGTNTVTATLATAGSVTFGPTALSNGMRFRFIPANSNTGAATLDITSPAGASSLGAKNIFLNGVALVGYELRKNCPVIVDYDGTQFHIISGAHGGDGVPIGASLERYYATAPAGYLLCDGSAVSRTTYADLFAFMGTTHGAGNGSTTFNLPNAARRVSVGSGGSGTGTLGNSVGNTGGAETHTLSLSETPAHAHGGSTASASGSFTAYDSAGSGDTHVANAGSGSPLTSVSVSVSASVSIVSEGGNGAHNNMQPSIVVYKVIKF